MLAIGWRTVSRFRKCARHREPQRVCSWPIVWARQNAMALIGFQGRGLEKVVQPDFCHNLFLEALTFQRAQKYVPILGQQGSIRPRNPIRASVGRIRHAPHRLAALPAPQQPRQQILPRVMPHRARCRRVSSTRQHRV